MKSQKKNKNLVKNNGITLISLVVTILVLIIVAGIVIATLNNENGIISKANEAELKSLEAKLDEQVKIAISDLSIYIKTKKSENNNYTCIIDNVTQYTLEENTYKYFFSEENFGNDKKTDWICINMLTSDSNTEKFVLTLIYSNEKYVQKRVGNRIYYINISLDGNITYDVSTQLLNNVNEGLLGYIELNINTTGYYDNIKINDEQYNIHAIVIKDDVTLDGNTIIDGVNLNNNVYEIGDSTTDVATGNTTTEEMAKYTVVFKVMGNLTICNNIQVTSCKSDSGYGGPKGLIIYCTGDFENNGTISMTARGAYAEGQNVYLYKNSDETYEYVPKIGGTGGKGRASTSGEKGQDGINVSKRATGGGRSW